MAFEGRDPQILINLISSNDVSSSDILKAAGKNLSTRIRSYHVWRKAIFTLPQIEYSHRITIITQLVRWLMRQPPLNRHDPNYERHVLRAFIYKVNESHSHRIITCMSEVSGNIMLSCCIRLGPF